jgi:hypothetical protein
MNCKTCEHFIPTFEDKGICTEHDAYVNEDYCCDDWEDKE